MTASTRTRPSGTPTSKRRRAADPEERFTRWVTIGFIALIVAVVAIVVLSFVADYWAQHFKSVASVNGTGISRDQWTERAELEVFRLDQQEQDIREAIAAEVISADEGNARIQALESAKSEAASTAIEDLIDLTYKGQLASQQGLSVTDADIDQAAIDESVSAESRRISLIAVEPQTELPSPTYQEVQAAYTAAHQAAEDLAAGTSFEETAKAWSTDASKDDGGDHGFVTAADETLDEAFLEVIFALEKDGITPVMEGSDGIYRIGKVTEIKPGTMDSGFEQAVRDSIGWDPYRNSLRMEVLAQRLEDQVVADATAGDVEQAHVAEVFLAGDPTLAVDEDEGTVHASHILYSPNDDPQNAASLPEDDPGWATAEAEAERAAMLLRRVTDVDARIGAFRQRARSQSDDTYSGAQGGELGFFGREDMVAEFGGPLFDDDTLVRGDIVGPIRTDYGWHVALFQERTPPLQERLDAVTARLDEAGADFASVARDLSEGAEAPAGGDLGWQTRAQLDEVAAEAVFKLAPEAVTEPVPLDDGYHVYRLEELATRPLDIEQRASTSTSAFPDWYEPQKTQAEDDGSITRDAEIYSDPIVVGG